MPVVENCFLSLCFGGFRSEVGGWLASLWPSAATACMLVFSESLKRERAEVTINPCSSCVPF